MNGALQPRLCSASYVWGVPANGRTVAARSDHAALMVDLES
jgi:hypothetical protein